MKSEKNRTFKYDSEKTKKITINYKNEDLFFEKD